MLTLDTPHRHLLAVGLSLFPLAAHADCMTAQDLLAGVMIENGAETPKVELHLRTGPDTVSDWVPTDTGAVARTDRLYGVYTTQEATTKDGAGWETNYQITFDDPAAVPPPGPELNWTAKAVFFDGFDKIDVIVSYSLGKEDTITVDGCPYRVLPVEMTLQQFGDDATPVDPEIGRQLYFPDLGTSTYVNYVLPNVSEHDDRPPPRRIYRRP